MKRVILLAAAAVGVLAVRKRVKEQQAERELWAEITDVPPTDAAASLDDRPASPEEDPA